MPNKPFRGGSTAKASSGIFVKIPISREHPSGRLSGELFSTILVGVTPTFPCPVSADNRCVPHSGAGLEEALIALLARMIKGFVVRLEAFSV